MPSRLCQAAIRHWCHHLRLNRCHLMLNSSKCKFLCANILQTRLDWHQASEHESIGWQAIQFYSRADTATLLNLYHTCVCIFMLESVQEFACKVCLKQWELDCDSMLHLLGITRLSTCQQSRKLVTLVQSRKWPNLFPSRNFCSRSTPYLSSGNFNSNLISPLKKLAQLC